MSAKIYQRTGKLDNLGIRSTTGTTCSHKQQIFVALTKRNHITHKSTVNGCNRNSHRYKQAHVYSLCFRRTFNQNLDIPSDFWKISNTGFVKHRPQVVEFFYVDGGTESTKLIFTFRYSQTCKKCIT
jgi:hypothetical protein